MKKFLIIASNANSLINFRGKLIEKISKLGHEIIAIAPEKNMDVIKKLNELNIKFSYYPMKRFSLSPINNIKSIISLFLLIKKIKPDIIFSYTIKPIIFTGIILLFLKKIKFYSLITGLGYTFQNQSLKRFFLKKLSILLYKISLIKSTAVIFQNIESKEIFIKEKIIKEKKCHVVNGSGIDLDYYYYCPIKEGKINFLLIARLLKEKGIFEYFQAAKKVKIQYPKVNFFILGPHDVSPDSISNEKFNSLLLERNVEYLGNSNNVRNFLQDCSVYVLPSYHEGIPRSVLEAMATGRPIITTNVIGCKETVIDGKNGFLIPKADSEILAQKMIWFIQNYDQCTKMGQNSRLLAEKIFDVKKINSNLLNIMGL